MGGGGGCLAILCHANNGKQFDCLMQFNKYLYLRALTFGLKERSKTCLKLNSKCCKVGKYRNVGQIWLEYPVLGPF